MIYIITLDPRPTPLCSKINFFVPLLFRRALESLVFRCKTTGQRHVRTCLLSLVAWFFEIFVTHSFLLLCCVKVKACSILSVFFPQNIDKKCRPKKRYDMTGNLLCNCDKLDDSGAGKIIWLWHISGFVAFLQIDQKIV